jgi:DNA-binding transcriptional regulator YiaG
MKPELKALFERLGPIQDIGRVHSGSRADIVLRPERGLAAVRTIDAARALIRRGVSARAALSAMDLLAERGEALIEVPMVEAGHSFTDEMRSAGVLISRLCAAKRADVRAIREHLGLTAAAFAKRFNFNQRTVEGWEQGRPIDEIANAYLHAIAAEPDAIARAFEDVVG